MRISFVSTGPMSEKKMRGQELVRATERSMGTPDSSRCKPARIVPSFLSAHLPLSYCSGDYVSTGANRDQFTKVVVHFDTGNGNLVTNVEDMSS